MDWEQAERYTVGAVLWPMKVMLGAGYRKIGRQAGDLDDCGSQA